MTMRRPLVLLTAVGLTVLVASLAASVFIFGAAVDCDLDCESPWVIVGGYAPLAVLATLWFTLRRRRLRPILVVGAIALSWQAAVLIYAYVTLSP